MEEKKIMKLLERNTKGLMILEVAKALNINRITASKYLAVLEARGYLIARPVGKAKLYYLKKTINPRRRTFLHVKNSQKTV